MAAGLEEDDEVQILGVCSPRRRRPDQSLPRELIVRNTQDADSLVMSDGGSYGNLSAQDQAEMDAALRAMGSPTPPHGCLGLRPEGVHAPATGETVVKFGEWLTRNQVLEETDGRLSTAAHEEKRELYLRLLSGPRQRGIPNFQLGPESSSSTTTVATWFGNPGPIRTGGSGGESWGNKKRSTTVQASLTTLGECGGAQPPASWEEEVT